MSKSSVAVDPELPVQEKTAAKRVILTMGGKGGVGKTAFMTALAEWFEVHRIPVTLLDLDTENKSRGSLRHYFENSALKINIHTPAGLDAFVDHLADGAKIILADMGAGSGQVAHDWFDSMHDDVAASGVLFTAIGVITPDPASVESVLSWATRLQQRVDYVIVENCTSPGAEFRYWEESEPAKRFREFFHPTVLRMEYRLADLENPARQHGATLGQVAERKTAVPELQKASLVMRAQAYRRRLFTTFDEVRDVLLP